MSPRGQSLAQREGEVARREESVRLWELTRSTVEAGSGDLREANEHLVMATLAAERLEEAAQKAKHLQDEFLAMLAHELRNPLAPIRSAVALLERLDTVDPRAWSSPSSANSRCDVSIGCSPGWVIQPRTLFANVMTGITIVLSQ
jgi:signal transduction histidine kinase